MTRVIEISDETFEKIKDQVLADGGKEVNSYEDFIGQKLFIRTVTYHLVGEVKKIVGRYLQLKNASWIADSGRFMNAIKDGTLNEVEPVGTTFVNMDTIVDFFPWVHKLPAEQK